MRCVRSGYRGGTAHETARRADAGGPAVLTAVTQVLICAPCLLHSLPPAISVATRQAMRVCQAVTVSAPASPGPRGLRRPKAQPSRLAHGALRNRSLRNLSASGYTQPRLLALSGGPCRSGDGAADGEDIGSRGGNGDSCRGGSGGAGSVVGGGQVRAPSPCGRDAVHAVWLWLWHLLHS